MSKLYVEQSEFLDYLDTVKKQYGSYRIAAKKLGINSAYFTFALQGKIYPRLLKALNVTIARPRSRLIINTTPATIARFHHQRGNATTGEHLEALMDKNEGIGKLDY